jgi:hypothetical protein
MAPPRHKTSYGIEKFQNREIYERGFVFGKRWEINDAEGFVGGAGKAGG